MAGSLQLLSEFRGELAVHVYFRERLLKAGGELPRGALLAVVHALDQEGSEDDAERGRPGARSRLRLYPPVKGTEGWQRVRRLGDAQHDATGDRGIFRVEQRDRSPFDLVRSEGRRAGACKREREGA